MFNKRRRSYRKGPPANQIYVPHDQRQLNPDPIPIMTEKQAQFYYKQLKDMGYIPPQIPPPDTDYQIFKIGTIDNTYGIKFQLNNDQTIRWYASLPPNLNVLDMNNQPIDQKYYDQINNKLAQNGYKIYPGKLLYDPAVYNDMSSGYLEVDGLYNSSSNDTLYTTQIQSGHNHIWTYIHTAYISTIDGSLAYMIDCDEDTADHVDHVGCVRIANLINKKYINVKAMEIIAVKT